MGKQIIIDYDEYLDLIKYKEAIEVVDRSLGWHKTRYTYDDPDRRAEVVLNDDMTKFFDVLKDADMLGENENLVIRKGRYY